VYSMTAPHCPKAADVWSSAVMLYTMLTGSYPFERPGDKGNPLGLQHMYQVGACQSLGAGW
jgi:serine/threonine protein kinase